MAKRNRWLAGAATAAMLVCAVTAAAERRYAPRTTRSGDASRSPAPTHSRARYVEYQETVPALAPDAIPFDGAAPAAEEPMADGPAFDELAPVPEGEWIEPDTGDVYQGDWYEPDDSYGDWYGADGCACGGCSFCPDPWFAVTEAIFTQRQRPRNIITSRDRADPIQVISGGQLITVANATAVMGTKSIDLDFETGTRITIGRYLGRDMISRDHTLEFVYFGLLDWTGDAMVENQSFSLIPLPGDSSQVVAVGGSLVSDFPNKFPATGQPSVGGFNYVQTHYIESWSRVNNFELNYRLRRSLEKDSLVGCSDGSWTRQPTPGHTPSIFAGVRYFEMNERFYFLSEGAIFAPFMPEVPPSQGGEYTIHTRNHMIGLQLGTDLVDEHITWNWGFRGKAGLYVNFAEQNSQVLINASPALFTIGNQFMSGSTAGVGFIGEAGFFGKYRWRPNIAFQLAWDMMWVQRLALAPEQLRFDFPEPTNFIGIGGSVMFHTLAAGVEFSW